MEEDYCTTIKKQRGMANSNHFNTISHNYAVIMMVTNVEEFQGYDVSSIFL